MPRGGEPERFDEVVLAAHADQALRDARRRRPTASTSCSARSPTSPTRPCCTPTRALLPRRRRAWASWNYHLLERPTGRPTVTYYMNRLQSLRRRPRVLRHAQPHRGDRPREGHPHDPVRAPRLHGRRAWRRRRATRRSAAAAARTSAARTGAGASTRTAWSARCGVAERPGGRAVTAQRALRGHGPPPPLRGARARVPPRLDARLPRPRRAAARCSAAGSCARRPGLVRFRRADYLGDPAVPLADAVRALVAERTGDAPDGPVRLLTHAALVRARASTR